MFFYATILSYSFTERKESQYKISKDNLNESIDQFEQSVISEPIKDSYVDIADNSDNRVSKTMSYVSAVCVDIIEFIALVFSNLVSMIL